MPPPVKSSVPVPLPVSVEPPPPPPPPPKVTPPDPVDNAVVVAGRDPDLVSRADDPSYRFLGGWAGAARNAVGMLQGEDPSDPAVAAKVCTGIAERAAHVLDEARRRGELPGVSAVRTIERRTVSGRDGALTPYHTAVAVTLEGGEEVVLDWHATLDIAHPVRSTPEAF